MRRLTSVLFGFSVLLTTIPVRAQENPKNVTHLYSCNYNESGSNESGDKKEIEVRFGAFSQNGAGITDSSKLELSNFKLNGTSVNNVTGNNFQPNTTPKNIVVVVDTTNIVDPESMAEAIKSTLAPRLTQSKDHLAFIFFDATEPGVLNKLIVANDPNTLNNLISEEALKGNPQKRSDKDPDKNKQFSAIKYAINQFSSALNPQNSRNIILVVTASSVNQEDEANVTGLADLAQKNNIAISSIVFRGSGEWTTAEKQKTRTYMSDLADKTAGFYKEDSDYVTDTFQQTNIENSLGLFNQSLASDWTLTAAVADNALALSETNKDVKLDLTLNGDQKQGIPCTYSSLRITFKDNTSNSTILEDADPIDVTINSITTGTKTVRYFLNSDKPEISPDTLKLDGKQTGTLGKNILHAEMEASALQHPLKADAALTIIRPLKLELLDSNKIGVKTLADNVTFIKASYTVPPQKTSDELKDQKVQFSVREANAAQNCTAAVPIGDPVPFTDKVATLELPDGLGKRLTDIQTNPDNKLIASIARDKLEIVACSTADPAIDKRGLLAWGTTLSQVVAANGESTPTNDTNVQKDNPSNVDLINSPLPPIVTTLLLLGLNLVILQRVNVARVVRLIDYPDGYPLPDNPLKVTVRNTKERQSYLLSKKTMSIGRGSENEIGLSDDKNISRRHGVLMWRNHSWYYTNRKSNLNAKVDGKPVRGYRMAKIKSGSVIEIGALALVVHSESFTGDPEDLISTNLN